MNTPKENVAAFQPQLYLITALSNMHVGSGKNNFGVIDNLIPVSYTHLTLPTNREV